MDFNRCANPECQGQGTGATFLCSNGCGRYVHLPSGNCGSKMQVDGRFYCLSCARTQERFEPGTRRDDDDLCASSAHAHSFSITSTHDDAALNVDDVIDLDANAVDRPDNDDDDVFWDEVDRDVLANFFGEHLVIASEEAGVADNIDASASAVIDNEPLRLPPLPPAGASINGATVNVRQSASDRRSIFVRSLHAADVAFGVNTEKGKKAFRRAFAMYDECMNPSFASRAYVATSEALPTPREKSISDEFVRLCEVEWRAKTGGSSYHFKLNEVPSKPARSTKSKAKQPEIDCNPVDQLPLRSSSASTGVGQAEMEFTVNDGAGQLRPENAPGLDIDDDAADDDDDDEGSGADLGGYSDTSGAPPDSAAHANITIGTAAELLVDMRKHADDQHKREELVTKFCVDFKAGAQRRRTQKSDQLPKCPHCGRSDIFTRPSEAVQRHIDSCQRRAQQLEQLQQ